MRQCCAEGELRAWLDRELPAEQASTVEQHLTECVACTAAYQEMASRAERVSALMEALSADIPMRPAAARTVVRPAVWAAVAALAAALVVAFLMSRQPGKVAMKVAAVTPPSPVASVEMPVVTVATVASPRPRFRHVPSKSVRPTPVQYYMALDEEPIETGLVMRVALASGMQADVIVDGDGRARAIRPVQNVLKEYEP